MSDLAWYRELRAYFRIDGYSTGTEIDLEIQLLRLVQPALAGAEIVTQRSEEVRHQRSGLMSISGIRLVVWSNHGS
jgi:hypothetical protein